MKAAVLSAVGGPITIEDIPTPSPKAGEVLVRVAACGVCHTDLHVVKGEVQFPLPCVLGHEISGVVEAVDVRDDKLEAARGLGATHTVNAAHQEAVAAVQTLTGGRGVDVAIEALGRPETVVNAFMMTRDGGRTVVIGIAPGTTTAGIEITRLVRRGIQLIGSYGSRVRTDMPDVLALAARGQVSASQPITRRYALAQADAAYGALNRGEIVGRAIVVMA
jgi:S-(hydroxymethyl)glutathione dehydrogenase/alcohol dehydrogenase